MFKLFKKEKKVFNVNDCFIDETFKKSYLFAENVKQGTLTANVGNYEKPVLLDIEKSPHVLIAGQTGSGKSVCINNILCSVIAKNTPDNLNLFIIDPKKVDYILYSDLPHVKEYVTSDSDILSLLERLHHEMNRRYEIMQSDKVDNIRDCQKKIPQIIILFDEYGSIQKGKTKNRIVEYVEMIAKLGRACGMHLIIGIQSPTTSNKEITSTLKNNIPCRIAFSVTNKQASKCIIDDTRYDSSKINVPGMGYIQQPMHETKAFKGCYISKEQKQAIINKWIELCPQNKR